MEKEISKFYPRNMIAAIRGGWLCFPAKTFEKNAQILQDNANRILQQLSQLQVEWFDDKDSVYTLGSFPDDYWKYALTEQELRDKYDLTEDAFQYLRNTLIRLIRHPKYARQLCAGEKNCFTISEHINWADYRPVMETELGTEILFPGNRDIPSLLMLRRNLRTLERLESYQDIFSYASTIGLLIQACNRSVPMASSVLHNLNPDIFPVLDVRTYRQIYNKEWVALPSNETMVAAYLQFLKDCHDYHRIFCPVFSFRHIGKILYQVDIEDETT